MEEAGGSNPPQPIFSTSPAFKRSAFAIAVLAVLAAAPEYVVDALYVWQAGAGRPARSADRRHGLLGRSGR
ncbi:hypothetical protein [Halorubrum yunnanense]|uniref:Uncharacterized protein n=1 Tax=Halorubrum yunnanense TaxID=1526162 RepID=A0ABD5YCL0_9EURY|nr:hypothetical protein [Halorubrum yunnanense]